MRSLYRIAVLVLHMLGSVLCDEEPASPTKSLKPDQMYSNTNEAFQNLINALPEESLHVALNSLPKFQDGVFESDRHGVEHVHHDNPPLATKLIVAAVQELKKRQAPAATNGTIATSSPPQTSQQPSDAPSSQEPSGAQSSDSPSPPASSKPAESAVVVPVEVTATDSAGQATVISSAILSKATAFIPVEVTGTNEAGSTVVSQETKPAVIFTATDSAGSAFVTTSAVNFAPIAGEVLTTTNTEGSTFLTTYTPDGGRVSSILLITTNGPNGELMVITSYTYVDPAAATTTDGQAPATDTARPGLQTGAARKNVAMMGGLAAVGGAFALFI